MIDASPRDFFKSRLQFVPHTPVLLKLPEKACAAGAPGGLSRNKVSHGGTLGTNTWDIPEADPGSATRGGRTPGVDMLECSGVRESRTLEVDFDYEFLAFENDQELGFGVKLIFCGVRTVGVRTKCTYLSAFSGCVFRHSESQHGSEFCSKQSRCQMKNK